MTQNTPTQQQALQYIDQHQHQRRFIYWLGGVRSGKSYGATQCFIQHAFENAVKDKCKLYIILGYTSPQVVTIYSNYFEEICRQEGLKCEVSRCTFDPHILITDEDTGASAKFLCRGADCDSKASAIQGLTLHGLLADEVANLNRATLHQAEARISEDGALRVYTSNKTSPHHWSVNYYVNRIREKQIDGIVLDAETRENKNVNNAYLKEREEEYQGDTLKRFIQNSFTLDAEPIYKIPTIATDSELLKKEPFVSNVFVYYHETGYEAMITYYDSQKQQYVISDGKSFELNEDFLFDELTSTIWVNSGNSFVVNELRSSGHPIRAYVNGFYDWKLKAIQCAIKRGHLVVAEDAGPIIEAIQLYNTPRRYEHLIIHCIEGMADLLTRHLKLRCATGVKWGNK